MKICFLADSDSIHTKRWCEYFVSRGNEVHLISFKPTPVANTHFHFIDTGKIDVKGRNWKVLLHSGKVKRLLKEIKPDILHAHYATSYGFTGARTGFHPYVVTALGTDILISPRNSAIYRRIIQYAFKKADAITLMADHMKNVIEELNLGKLDKCRTIPFGIDTQVFSSDGKIDNQVFTITSTRNFEDVYNIPHLIKSVVKAKSQLGEIKLNLIGDGSKRNEIEKLIDDNGLRNCTTFYGRISQPEIASVLNKSNVFVTVSLSDGNNISLNEAMACGPVCIATEIPANTQWINHKENGFLVKIDDVDTLSNYLVQVKNEFNILQPKMFSLNQSIINEKANWQKNMQKVEHLYQELCKKIK